MAKTDSNVAATTSAAMSPYATACAARPHDSKAPVLKTTPIPWAKRFGGPGTNRWAMCSRGVTTRVAN